MTLKVERPDVGIEEGVADQAVDSDAAELRRRRRLHRREILARLAERAKRDGEIGLEKSPPGERRLHAPGFVPAWGGHETGLPHPSGGPAYFLTQNSPPHSIIYLTGGSIGQGIPAATGAAVACPDRRVIALQADGAGMYTLQGLWTQAREGLNVTTIVFSNRAYQILRVELARCGLTERGPRAEALTDLGHPDLDWVALARGLGVPATRPDSAEAFHADLARALAEPGPRLIEVVLHGP